MVRPQPYRPLRLAPYHLARVANRFFPMPIDNDIGWYCPHPSTVCCIVSEEWTCAPINAKCGGESGAGKFGAGAVVAGVVAVGAIALV